MEEAAGLKVEFVAPNEDENKHDEHLRLVKFVTLFSQVGFKEFTLNETFISDFKKTY